MLSHDTFRARLQLTLTALEYWLPEIADVAHIEKTEADDAWRVSSLPVNRTSCPFELVLRYDQKYDLMVAAETYEDLPIGTFDLFLPLAQAIADGRVVTRRHSSALTGLVQKVETIITLADGQTWRDARACPGAPPGDDPLTLFADRHYLPYRRDRR